MGEEVTTTAANLEYLNYIAYHTVGKDISEFNLKNKGYGTNCSMARHNPGRKSTSRF